MKKEAVKVGVREYFKTKINKVEEKKENPIVVISDAEKPKKKVKKSYLYLEFEDHPTYKFEKMGGIEDVLI